MRKAVLYVRNLGDEKVIPLSLIPSETTFLSTNEQLIYDSAPSYGIQFLK